MNQNQQQLVVKALRALHDLSNTKNDMVWDELQKVFEAHGINYSAVVSAKTIMEVHRVAK